MKVLVTGVDGYIGSVLVPILTRVSVDTFDFRPLTRLKQLQYLLRTAQLDDNFFWSDAKAPAT